MAAIAAVGEPVALGAMHQTLGTQAAVAAVGKTQVGQIGVASGRVANQAQSVCCMLSKVRHGTLAIGFSPHGTSNLAQTLTTC